MSKQATLGENVQKETFKALALQVPGGHFLIFTGTSGKFVFTGKLGYR